MIRYENKGMELISLGHKDEVNVEAPSISDYVIYAIKNEENGYIRIHDKLDDIGFTKVKDAAKKYKNVNNAFRTKKALERKLNIELDVIVIGTIKTLGETFYD